LEKERDFYFGKLRDIEVLCQNESEKTPLIEEILKVLYATEVYALSSFDAGSSLAYVQYLSSTHVM
jgi:RP/EB family microtubule-associated protein